MVVLGGGGGNDVVQLKQGVRRGALPCSDVQMLAAVLGNVQAMPEVPSSAKRHCKPRSIRLRIPSEALKPQAAYNLRLV